MLAALEMRLALAVRRAIFGAIAAVLALAGIAVLMAAAWIAIASASSHLVAALSIGGGLIVLSFLSLLLGRRRRVSPQAAMAAQRMEMVQAFLAGLSAGVRSRKQTPPPR